MCQIFIVVMSDLKQSEIFELIKKQSFWKQENAKPNFEEDNWVFELVYGDGTG